MHVCLHVHIFTANMHAHINMHTHAAMRVTRNLCAFLTFQCTRVHTDVHMYIRMYEVVCLSAYMNT